MFVLMDGEILGITLPSEQPINVDFMMDPLYYHRKNYVFKIDF